MRKKLNSSEVCFEMCSKCVCQMPRFLECFAFIWWGDHITRDAYSLLASSTLTPHSKQNRHGERRSLHCIRLLLISYFHILDVMRTSIHSERYALTEKNTKRHRLKLAIPLNRLFCFMSTARQNKSTWHVDNSIADMRQKTEPQSMERVFMRNVLRNKGVTKKWMNNQNLREKNCSIWYSYNYD